MECLYPRCEQCLGIVMMEKEEQCPCMDVGCDLLWQQWRCQKCGMKYEREDSN